MNQETLRPHLEHILENARLLTLLQPVLDLAEGRLMGYEALSRGPSDSPLHAPQVLFATAEQHEVVLSGCPDDDLSKEEGRAGPAGMQQQMALGDGIVAAIAFVGKYPPFRITSACGQIFRRNAEIHRRIDLSEFSPTLN